MMKNAARGSIPRSSITPGRRSTAWWNPEVKGAVRKRRKALRKLKKLPDDHELKAKAAEDFRNARNLCRKTIFEAKAKSWSDFLDGIDPSSNITELWRRVNVLSGKRRTRGFAIVIGDSSSENPETIAAEIGQYFANLAATSSYPPEFKIKKAAIDQIPTIFAPDAGEIAQYNTPFSPRELSNALGTAHGKSTGPDQVGYPMITHLPPVGKQQLLDAFNDIWSRGQFPDEWKVSTVIPIPKSSNRIKKPCDFRPISLLSCVSKTLERMVNLRLTSFLEENDYLDHRQFAFRKGKGAGIYLGSLGETLDSELEQGNHIDLVTLDISKAYNTIWREETLRTLAKWGISGNLGNFISGFLNNRRFRVAIGGTMSQEFFEENGVPQGSILSVTLFLIAMNSVFQNLPKGVYIFVYADDIILFAAGRSPKLVRKKLQQAVTLVGQWATSVGFRIAAEKCSICHICNHRHNPYGNQIKLNGTVIPYRKTIKIIGVTIDKLLNFKTHYETIKQECDSRRRLIRTISSHHNVNNRRTIINITNSIITSKLTYGIELCGRNLAKMVETFSPVYNTAMRNASGLLPCTPATSTCIEAGTLTFEYVAKLTLINRSINFLEKTTGNSAYLLRQAKTTARDIARTNIPPILRIPRVFPRSWYTSGPIIDWHFKKLLKARDNHAKVKAVFLQHSNSKYKNHLKWFTDGSKLGDAVGIGICSPDQNRNVHQRLPKTYSIFSAEAAAIFVAITEASQNSIPSVIFSDSASVLSALEAGQSRHSWIQAIEDASQPHITLCWVPGHCGIEGNETADSLANEGRESTTLFIKKTPGPDIKNRIKTLATMNFQAQWRAETTHALREVKQDTRPWTDTSNRREQTKLSRLRTGYTRFSHFPDNGKFSRPLCENCGVHNSVKHVLIFCPIYQNLRDHHGISDSLREVLANDPETEGKLMSFLRETNLYDRI